MSAVIPFLRPAAARTTSWSQQELAEFYRVEAALIRAGIGIASEHGLSDEGEPWFVFCRPDGDAIMHFARIDGSYLIASEVLDRPVRGPDFRAMIDQIARRHPELLPIPAAVAGTKLVVHPAALLAALVAAAALSLSSQDAHAGEIEAGLEGAPPPRGSGGDGVADGQPQPAKAKGAPESSEQTGGRKQIEAIILSTMMFAAEALANDPHEANADPSLVPSDPTSGAPMHLGQGDGPAGTRVAIGSGTGADSAAQPAVLTAPGSGTSQGAAAPGGRIDTAPVVRTDFPGERSGPTGSEVGHREPGAGVEAGPGGTPAEAGGARTGGLQSSPTGHIANGAETADGSGAGSSDPRASSSAVSTADPGTAAVPADAGQSEAGSGAALKAWTDVAGHTGAKPAPTTATSRDADERDPGIGQGSQAGTARTDGADGDRDGRGHGAQAQSAAHGEADSASHGDSQGRPSGQDREDGSATHGQAASAASDAPAPNGAPESDPAPEGQRAQPGQDSHGARAADPAPGHGAPTGDGDVRPEPAPAGSSSGTVYSAADQHPGKGADAAASRGGSEAPGTEAAAPGAAADHTSAPARDGSPAAEAASAEHGPAGPPDRGSGHAAASATPVHPQGGDSSDPTAQDTAPGNGTAPASSHSHGPTAEAGPHPSDGPAPHGHGPDTAVQGPVAQEGSGPPTPQDHPGAGTPPAADAQDAPSGPQHPHADNVPSAHGAGGAGGAQTSASGGDASSHGEAAQDLAASPGGPGPTAASQGEVVSHGEAATAHQSQGHAVSGSPPGDAVGQGSAQPPAVEPQHPSAGNASDQAGTLPPPGQGGSGGAAKAEPASQVGTNSDQTGPQRASIDASGNLVFHGDIHQDPSAPVAAPGPADPGAHPDMGLVGVSDQPHVVHDLYHHT